MEGNKEQEKNAADLIFLFTRGTLYAKEDEKNFRSCPVIPKSMEAEIFTYAYDQLGNLGYDLTHESLSAHFYIFDFGN